MRIALALALTVNLALLGCDAKKGDDKTGAASASAMVSAAPTAAPTATAAATAAVKRQMPPRPFPLGSSGPLQPSAPPEQHMMAIGYTIAMVGPEPSDALVDKAYVDEMVTKLETAARTADKGKTPANPAKALNGNRRLHVDLGKGCTEKLPSNLVAQRAGSSLRAAFDAGVLVISCRDQKWECHQSTRDSTDVLCLAAPRSGR